MKLLIGNNLYGTGAKLAERLEVLGYEAECCGNSVASISRRLSEVSCDGIVLFVTQETPGLLDFIRTARSAQPELIIVTAVYSAFGNICSRLSSAGADRCVTMPVTVSELCLIVVCAVPRNCRSPFMPEIGCFLMEHGFPYLISGFGYLCTGTELVLQRPKFLRHITEELYPGIAQRMATSPELVERSLRHYSKLCCRNGAASRLTGIPELTGVKNSELIAAAAGAFAERYRLFGSEYQQYM